MPNFAYRALTASGRAGHRRAGGRRRADRDRPAAGQRPDPDRRDAGRARSTAAAPHRSRPTRAVKHVTQLSRELATLIGRRPDGREVRCRWRARRCPTEGWPRRWRACCSRCAAARASATRWPPSRATSRRSMSASCAPARRPAGSARRWASSPPCASGPRRCGSKLTSALIYPVVLLLTAIGAVVVLLTVVVPRMEPMFASGGRGAAGQHPRRAGRDRSPARTGLSAAGPAGRRPAARRAAAAPARPAPGRRRLAAARAAPGPAAARPDHGPAVPRRSPPASAAGSTCRRPWWSAATCWAICMPGRRWRR